MIKYLRFILFFLPSVIFSEYYSQYGQDQFVNENFFKNRTKGIFVDIGAHNGISLSNTYFFEKELDWTGICIEPIPHVFKQLQKNRNCLCICSCITTEHNTIQHFLQISGYPEMLSGLVDKFDKRHLDRITHEIKESGGLAKSLMLLAIISIGF
ncbi:MAG: FkbM family methyltransferase [Chlamydiales bacterium]